MRRALFLAALLCVAGASALAQDPVKVDSKHYKLVMENDQVRVLKIHYGPKEKSVMHDHPDGVAVFLIDAHVKFTYPGGKTEEQHRKAGESGWTERGKHLPENLGDKPFELILVELKAKPAKAPVGKPASD